MFIIHRFNRLILKCSLLIVFFLLLVLSTLQAQQNIVDKLEFNSDFEKIIFSTLDSVDDVKLLLAIDSEASEDKVNLVWQRIQQVRATLDAKKFELKKNEKKVKMLFDETHEAFFTQYKNVASFNEIFDSKQYNCVSATALYALLLNEYNIPYLIKEKPTHVYIVAYPTTNSILLESTAPQSGYYSPSNNDLQKIVSSLVDMKFITQEEVDRKGVRKVYNEFYFSDDNISIKKLAGLQYYNEALVAFDEENYKKALKTIRKAQVLYPSDKTDYVEYIVLASLINGSKYNDISDIHIMVEYMNINPDDENNKFLANYEYILNDKLFKEGDSEYIDSAFSYINTNLINDSLKSQIAESHYFGYARYYMQKNKEKQSLAYAKKAFAINDKNVNTKSIILYSVMQRMAMSSGSKSTIDKLDSYAEEFPFLKEDSQFQSFYYQVKG